MTIKQDVHNRVVEIEKKLCKRDAYDLWQCCHLKIIKIRHLIYDKADRIWEVDEFFKRKENQPYCVLAEIELPETASRPSNLPNFITDHLVFEVPLGDSRFSNKKLWNLEHVNELYLQLA